MKTKQLIAVALLLVMVATGCSPKTATTSCYPCKDRHGRTWY
jgi:hypothetical protein